MSDKTKIEWTDATCTDRGGRRVRVYVRQNPQRPGQQQRRAMAAIGQSWCRGCQDWLPIEQVTQGACRPHLNEEARARYATDPEPYRARVYARKRDLDPIPVWWSEWLHEQFGGLCAYGCGAVATTHEHIWPVNDGGQSEPGNVVPACVACNSSKRDRDPSPWILRGFNALPSAWTEVVAMAVERGVEWAEVS